MGFKSLMVYKKAFELAMEIFEVTKSFPVEEKFSLVNQIRRSSRSVNAQIAEAYRKRQYPAHFLSKISDGDMENSETIVWLDFACACDYITKEQYNHLMERANEVGKMLNYMMRFPEKYMSKTDKSKMEIDN